MTAKGKFPSPEQEHLL